MDLTQRVIEFLEEDLRPFTPDEVKKVFGERGLEGDLEAISREVVEEGVRRSMEAVRGLREVFGKLPYPEAVLEEHLQQGGKVIVSLFTTRPNLRGLHGKVGLWHENRGLKETEFYLEDLDGRLPYRLYFFTRPGLPEVSLPNLVATRERVFFTDHERNLEHTLKNLKALRPLFASLKLSDIEEAMEALFGLEDGEARMQGAYVIARSGRGYALRRGSVLGDPRLDGALLLAEDVRLSFPLGVEIALRARWSPGNATLNWVRINLGEEEVLLDGRTSDISPLHRDPLTSELQAILAENLDALEREGTLSPKMLAFLRAFVEHEDPLRALAEGKFSPYVTAELFRGF